MKADYLDDYLNTIDELKEKYEGTIEIYTGLEADFYPAVWIGEARLELIILLVPCIFEKRANRFCYGFRRNKGRVHNNLKRVLTTISILYFGLTLKSSETCF